MQTIKKEHFTPPTSPLQMPSLMSSAKFVMSPTLLGLKGKNCPDDNFTSALSSTCSCIPNVNGYSKSWLPNSNYTDMFTCQ